MANGDSEVIKGELARRELARRSYGEYLAYTNGETWKRTKFSEYLAGQVQLFIEEETDNAYEILLIEAPPQHGKSISVTEALPSWYMGKYPNANVIMASYNDETAEKFNRRNKEKVRQYGNSLFGIRIGAIDRSTEFELDNGSGRMISRGILSGITGNPANLLIVDDPVKNRQEADSPSRRQLMWGEWLGVLKARLAAHAKIIVIMTPWHEDDMAARIIATEPRLRLIRLPVEAEAGDLMGREIGAPLCPEIGKDSGWLHQYKESYLSDPSGGARAWSSLYQCAPRVEGGNLVKREWWKRYDPMEIKEFATEIISVDAAFKGNDDNDFVAIEVWGKIGTDYYLRYVLNRHLDFPDTLIAIRAVKGLFPRARAVLIEDKANGSAIISVLQKEMFCIPVTPLGGKISRVNGVSPAIESGHVFVPDGMPFTDEFVDQFTSFPAGRNDDMVDSATQALAYLFNSSGEQAAIEEENPIEALNMGEDFLDSELCYDVYGTEDG